MERTKKIYSGADLAKKLRSEIKKAGHEKVVEVKSRESLYNTVLDVKITSLSIKKSEIERIARPFEEIRYDERSYEVLDGANVFVRIDYDHRLLKEFVDENAELVKSKYHEIIDEHARENGGSAGYIAFEETGKRIIFYPKALLHGKPEARLKNDQDGTEKAVIATDPMDLINLYFLMKHE